MVGSTYAPQRWSDVEAGKVQPHTFGVKGTIQSGQTQNVDTVVADDHFISEIELMCNNQSFGDTISLSIVDIDGVYAAKETVLATPVANFNIIADSQKQANYKSVCPFKILGGVYLRISYTSTGGLVGVTIGANFILQKVLI